MKTKILALTALSVFVTIFISSVAISRDFTPTIDINKIQNIRGTSEARWDSLRSLLYWDLRDAGVFDSLETTTSMSVVGVKEDSTWVVYEPYNVNAAITTRTNLVQPGGLSGYNLDGSTIKGLYMWDVYAVNSDHVEYGYPDSPRVFAHDSDNRSGSYHPWTVAGTLVSAGTYSAPSRGMAPNTTLNTYSFIDDQTEICDVILMTVDTDSLIRVSNHSYGSNDTYFSEYGPIASTYDDIMANDAWYCIVLAAGNYGSQGIPSSQTGKNPICVGAVYDVPNYTGPESVTLWEGVDNLKSSYGPTEWGRIKPDVVGSGDSLWTTSANSNSHTTYGWGSATSHASPNVAGSLFLMYERYENTHGEFPLWSTMKALLINTADECGPSPGPDKHFGFGLVNTRRAIDMIDIDANSDTMAIEEGMITAFDWYLDRDYYYYYDGLAPARITIAWSDPAGEFLVNDIDMKVIEMPSGGEYYPFVMSSGGGVTEGINSNDPVEYILMDDASSGFYKVSLDVATFGADTSFYGLVVRGMDGVQYHYGDITENTTWGPGKIFIEGHNSNVIQIDEGVSLTIAPGTTIIPYDSDIKLLCYGEINAVGYDQSQENRIVFDTYDGNNDISIQLGELGVGSGGASNSKIRYCDFHCAEEYAIDIQCEMNSASGYELYSNHFYDCAIGIHMNGELGPAFANIDLCSFEVERGTYFDLPSVGILIRERIGEDITITNCSFTRIHHSILCEWSDGVNLYSNTIDMTNADFQDWDDDDLNSLDSRHWRPRGILVTSTSDIEIINNTFRTEEFNLPNNTDPGVTRGMGLANAIRIESCGLEPRIEGNSIEIYGEVLPVRGHNWYGMVFNNTTPRVLDNYVNGTKLCVYEYGGSSALYCDNSYLNDPLSGNDFYNHSSWWGAIRQTVVHVVPEVDLGFNRFTYDVPIAVGIKEYDNPWTYENGNPLTPYSMTKNYWEVTTDVNELANWHQNANERWRFGFVRTDLDLGEPSGGVYPNPWYDDYDELFDLTPIASNGGGGLDYVRHAQVPNQYNSMSAARQAIDRATYYMAQGALVQAKNELVTGTSYTNDSHTILALSRLINLQKFTGLDTINVSSNLQTLASSTSNSRIKFLCNHGLAMIDAKAGNFEDAVEFYEDFMDTTSSVTDSIDAAIYAGEIYLMAAMAETPTTSDPGMVERLAMVDDLGDYSSLRPLSIAHQAFRADSLYASLDNSRPNTYNITGNDEWASRHIELEDDVTVQSGGSLTISHGTWVVGDEVTIDVYGEIQFVGYQESPIWFHSRSPGHQGVNIVLHDGCSVLSSIKSCYFDSSEVAITIEEELSTTMSDLTFVDCELGIYIPSTPATSSLDVQIDSCYFESDGEYRDAGIVLNDPAQGSTISNCRFYGAMKPISITSGSAVIEDCYFEIDSTVETENDVAAIDLTYFSGQVQHNSIYRFPTGIRLYDSDVFLRETKIEECWNEGLWLLNDSHPVMNGTYGPKNWLYSNGAESVVPAQIRIEGNVYPYMADGQNNIWQATSGYAISSVTAPSTSTNLENNYWGTTTPSGPNLFNPYSAHLDFDPYYTSEQTPTGGYQTESIGDNLLVTALGDFDAGDFADAIDGFELVVAQDNGTSNRVGALSRILDCYMMDGSISSSGLYSYYASVLATETDERVRREAEQCVALLDISEGDYDSAIDYYEGVILDPNTSYQDSVYAVIDLGYAYLASGGNGGGISAMDDLYPRTVAAHQKHVEELMAELRINRYRVRSAAEQLPTEFALQAAYPNPFNPSIMIPYDLPEDSHVEIAIYNVMGQKVETLVNTRVKAGYHHIVWNSGTNGKLLASGVYFVQMKAADFIDTQKIVMLK